MPRLQSDQKQAQLFHCLQTTHVPLNMLYAASKKRMSANSAGAGNYNKRRMQPLNLPPRLVFVRRIFYGMSIMLLIVLTFTAKIYVDRSYPANKCRVAGYSIDKVSDTSVASGSKHGTPPQHNDPGYRLTWHVRFDGMSPDTTFPITHVERGITENDAHAHIIMRPVLSDNICFMDDTLGPTWLTGETLKRYQKSGPLYALSIFGFITFTILVMERILETLYGRLFF